MEKTGLLGRITEVEQTPEVMHIVAVKALE